MKIEAFVNRQGDKITEAEWLELRRNPDYRMVREYGNKDFHVRAMWIGKLDYYARNEAEAKLKFRPFELIVIRNKDGLPIQKEGDSAGYATESELINGYEDFLVRHRLAEWIPSTISGEHHFIEKGNLMRSSGDAPATMGDGGDIEAACSW